MNIDIKNEFNSLDQAEIISENNNIDKELAVKITEIKRREVIENKEKTRTKKFIH
ncbi:hypothetical protein Glove_220g16 [Diversispora epigaea]|uniref:Uncharacterized protein n=1 Tax=Diversispora epigaea TaxID=1348612 RepID=A0A397INN3_9GLOM|nr:hypothetical protein Glove_220g16 [Diversispora epigaea]